MIAWNIIRSVFKLLFQQLPITVAIFGILPLTLFLISSTGRMTTLPNILVEVVDEDQSDLSRQFIQLFESEPFELVDAAAAYRVTIPSGYQDSILNRDPLVIEVEALEWVRQSLENLFLLTIESYHQQLNEMISVKENEIELNEEFFVQLNSINEANAIITEFVFSESDLMSTDHSVIFVSSVFFMYGVVQIGMSKFVVAETGFNSRMHMLPLTRKRSYHYGLLEAFVTLFILFSISFLTLAIFSSQLRGQLVYFIPVIVLMVLFAVSLGQLINEFLPATMGKGLLSMLVLFEVYIGWTGLGLEFPELYRFWPGMVVQELVEAALTNQWADFRGDALIVLGICLVIYTMVRVKIFVKWGRQ